MTPEEVHAAIDTRRRAARRTWWQIAVELDTCEDVLRRMSEGMLSQRLRERAEAWLGGAGV